MESKGPRVFFVAHFGCIKPLWNSGEQLYLSSNSYYITHSMHVYDNMFTDYYNKN